MGFDTSGYTGFDQKLRLLRGRCSIAFTSPPFRTLGALFFCCAERLCVCQAPFPRRDKLFIIMLLTMMLPYQAYDHSLLPADGQGLQVVRYLLALLAACVCRGFRHLLGCASSSRSSVPDEMLEAATIDGCSVFGAFLRIVVPLIMPGLRCGHPRPSVPLSTISSCRC